MLPRAMCPALLLAGWAALGGCGLRAASPPAPAALRVATSGDYAPFSSAHDGALSGLDVTVAERFAADLGVPLVFVRRGWSDLPEAPARGEADVAMSGITMRPERALLGRYTRPYAHVGTVVLVRASDGRRFAAIAELDRPEVRVAVNAGGHLERVARALFPHAGVRPTADNRQVLARLLEGRADAAVTDTAEVRAWMRPSLRVLGPVGIDYKAYLLAADDAALAERLDGWLVARERDGWLDAERVRWLGPSTHMDPDTATRQAVAALVRLRLELMPAVAAAKAAAGLPLEDPEQEGRVLTWVATHATDPAAATTVYRQLIALAKQVQRAAPAAAATSPLTALRGAIRRVDVQLVRELDRAPATPATEWQTVLAATLSAPGVGPDGLSSLAAALALTGTRNSPGARVGLWFPAARWAMGGGCKTGIACGSCLPTSNGSTSRRWWRAVPRIAATRTCRSPRPRRSGARRFGPSSSSASGRSNAFPPRSMSCLRRMTRSWSSAPKCGTTPPASARRCASPRSSRSATGSSPSGATTGTRRRSSRNNRRAGFPTSLGEPIPRQEDHR